MTQLLRSSKRRSKFAIVLIFLFLLLFWNSESSAQDESSDCGTCYGAQSQNCSTSCEQKLPNQKDSGKFQKCKRTCVIEACNEICKYNLKNKESIASSLPETINCDYCTRNAQNSCQEKCNLSDESCLKKCISQTCKNSCSLPTSTNDFFKSNDSSCQSCKAEEAVVCEENCGSGLGSLTCKTVCIQRSCEKKCLID